jgi:hypothetical protein
MSWSDKYEPPEQRKYLEMIASSGKGRVGRRLTGPVSATLVLAGLTLAVVVIIALL